MQLRDVYGETFWLIGVFAPEMVRKQRLLSEGHDSPYIEKIFQRDQDEGLPFGQRVRATMQLSDFFIRNDRSNDARLANTITRFLEILFGVVIHIPTIDESSMNAASAAAGGSACLSRQVGAVVVTEAGDLIGRGVNDVPKFGGGLYTAANGDDDHRCFKWKSKIFHNDDRKNRLSESLVMALRGTEAIKKGSESNARDVIQKSEVKNLIEFSRAVHAEMEAILSVARGAKPGLVGSTLYCTTFPCHSCARLIVASGIHKVVYIEAYIKSLAIDLHETRSRWMKSRSERRLSSCSTRVLLPAI